MPWWGTGAAATQCEGAAPRSDWAGWEAEGRVPPSGDGNGFRTRYADDFALLAEHGITHHRLTIEWGRLEPSEGRWDEDEVAHLRRVLEAGRDAGVVPVVVAASARREGAVAVAQPGLQIGLVDRHPPGHQVAERVGHPVDVPGPGERGGLVVEPAPLVVGEPARRRAVEQAGPHVDTRLASRCQHAAHVGRLVVVPLALGRF